MFDMFFYIHMIHIHIYYTRVRYFPLIMAKPYLVIFFMPLFLFLSLGLMNLVTAVLVEHALEHAAHEHDAERLKTKQKIKATAELKKGISIRRRL